jgi:FkbM family methyltransferase
MIPLMERARRIGRAILPRSVFDMASHAYNRRVGKQKLGSAGYERLLACAAPIHAHDGTTTTLNIPDLQFPFTIRNGTSDATEIIHTVLRETYGPNSPPTGTAVTTVIDAGANLGDTAAWFATRYPQSRVVSLEPDRDNYSALVRNAAPYGERVVPLNVGLWPKSGPLRVVTSESRTAFSVVEAKPGEPFDCQAVSPMQLVRDFGMTKIDLFKIDIEGSELQLFSAPDADDWLSITGTIMMEIHGPAEAEAVEMAVARHGFVKHIHREVITFQHPKNAIR